MSLDLCYSHIRAGDRCAIYAHAICVSENYSIGGLQVRIHLGAKNITFQFWRGWCHCRGYKARIPLLFIVMLELYIKGSLNGVVGSVDVWGSARRCCPIQWV